MFVYSHVLDIDLADFGSDIEVRAEEITADNRRIDFTIKSSKYYIGIEMKVNAADQKNQIKDYYDFLLEEAKHNNQQQVQMYYLTKFGVQPSTDSIGSSSASVKLISFKQHILSWIDHCQHEVRNIANLNLAFEDYRNIVHKITKSYKGNVVTIPDELAKSDAKHLLESALKLDRHMLSIKGNSLFAFFEQVKASLEKAGYSDISASMANQDYVATNGNCCKWFENPYGYKGHVGYYFDCGFSDDLYLLVEIATDHLHFGIVTCINATARYELVDTPETRFSPGLAHRKWKSFKQWHSKDCGNIRSLDDTAIELLLGFEGSKLKGDILALINSVKALSSV
ncbi:PD-(D/E)XK nuclease family protein [Moritella viscosa]